MKNVKTHIIYIHYVEAPLPVCTFKINSPKNISKFPFLREHSKLQATCELSWGCHQWRLGEFAATRNSHFTGRFGSWRVERMRHFRDVKGAHFIVKKTITDNLWCVLVEPTACLYIFVINKTDAHNRYFRRVRRWCFEGNLVGSDRVRLWVMQHCCRRLPRCCEILRDETSMRKTGGTTRPPPPEKLRWQEKTSMNEDVFAIKNGDCPLPCSFSGGVDDRTRLHLLFNSTSDTELGPCSAITIYIYLWPCGWSIYSTPNLSISQGGSFLFKRYPTRSITEI